MCGSLIGSSSAELKIPFPPEAVTNFARSASALAFLIPVTILETSPVFIKIENYCEAEIYKNEENLIATTKTDSKNHGFGLKSIRAAVEKYDGSVAFGVQQNWFELKILLPRVL
jgi:hypothetical protein